MLPFNIDGKKVCFWYKSTSYTHRDKGQMNAQFIEFLKVAKLLFDIHTTVGGKIVDICIWCC